jgi:hypothetical protein
VSKHIVQVWEHDRWSGVKLAWTKKYKHRRSAIRYRNQINGENTLPQVPETYYKANLKGE